MMRNGLAKVAGSLI